MTDTTDERRTTHRKAVLYWLRGVYSAAVWGLKARPDRPSM